MWSISNKDFANISLADNNIAIRFHMTYYLCSSKIKSNGIQSGVQENSGNKR